VSGRACSWLPEMTVPAPAPTSSGPPTTLRDRSWGHRLDHYRPAALGPLKPHGRTAPACLPRTTVPIPSYQQLPGVINSSNQGSTTLRNIPNVAAEADYRPIQLLGTEPRRLDGRNQAMPLRNGLALTAMGQPTSCGYCKATVGFLNPTLYSIGTGSSKDSCYKRN